MVPRLRLKLHKIKSKPVFLIIFLYFLLATIFTFPLLFSLNKFTMTGGDGSIFIWHIWWLRKAIFQLHQNPLFSYYVFQPIGIDLTLPLQQFSGVEALLSLVFHFFRVSPVATYNFLVFISFILAGFSTYLLASFFLKERLIAFISGLIYSFSSFRALRAMGHLDTLFTYWIPLFILFLFKFLREKKYAYLYYVGLFFLLGTYASMQNFIFMVMFGIIFAIFYRKDILIILRKNFSHLFYFSSFILLGLIPKIYFAFRVIFRNLEEVEIWGGWKGANVLSGDLISYFIPHEESFLFGFLGRAALKGKDLDWESKQMYLGYFVIFLLVFAIWKFFKKSREVKLWTLIFFVFVIFSLGPSLKVFGFDKFIIDTNTFSYSSPLPYFIFHFIPILKDFRAPGRFFIMFSLAAAILSGFALLGIKEIFKGKRIWFLVFSILLASLIFLDSYHPFIFPSNKSSPHPFYQKMAEDKNEYTILDLPLLVRSGYYDFGYGDASPFFYQTIHNKKIIGGYIARIPNRYYDFYEKIPLLKAIIDFQKREISLKVVSPDEQKLNKIFVHQANLKYVLIREPYNNNPEVIKFLKQSLPISVFYEDETLKVFEIN